MNQFFWSQASLRLAAACSILLFTASASRAAYPFCYTLETVSSCLDLSMEPRCDRSCHTVTYTKTVRGPNNTAQTIEEQVVECKDKGKWFNDLYSPMLLDECMHTSEIEDGLEENDPDGRRYCDRTFIRCGSIAECATSCQELADGTMMCYLARGHNVHGQTAVLSGPACD